MKFQKWNSGKNANQKNAIWFRFCIWKCYVWYYLLIYLYIWEKYGLRKKRTMRMFLSNPNVNRLSINSKLENFPRRTRFDLKVKNLANRCHQKVLNSVSLLKIYSEKVDVPGRPFSDAASSSKHWLEVDLSISDFENLAWDLSLIISGLLCEWNHFRFGAIEVLKSKRLWQV